MRGVVISFLPLAAPLTLLAGCGVERGPTAKLDHVAPSSAYSDATTAISLVGGPFRPSFRVTTETGAAEVGNSPFTVFLDPTSALEARKSIYAIDAHWRNNKEIDARIPEGLFPGDYSVHMNDPRGQEVRSTLVFTSLGPDNDLPLVTFLLPASDSAVGGGEKVSVSVGVSDGAGHVRSASWSARSVSLGFKGDDCTVPEEQPADVVCNFSFVAPMAGTNLEPVDIRVDAWDSVQNHASAARQIRVAWSPKVDVVIPDAGPTTGGTQIIVKGTGFIPGLSRILIDGLPIVSDVCVDSICGTTDPHVPSDAAILTVANGSSTSGMKPFHFVPPPRLREVSPTHGAAKAWTLVTLAGNHFRPETTFYWSQKGSPQPIVPDPLPSPPPDTPLIMYVNPNRVSITLPPGSGVISLIASDPVSGESQLANAFAYDDDPSP